MRLPPLVRRSHPFTRPRHLPPSIRCLSSLPNSPLFRALRKHDPASPAVSHVGSGKTFTYGDLVRDVLGFSKILVDRVGEEQLAGRQVAICADNGYSYVVSLLSTWATRAIAVPLCTAHPPPELRYVLYDSTASTLISSPRYHFLLDETLRLPWSIPEDPDKALHLSVDQWLEVKSFIGGGTDGVTTMPVSAPSTTTGTSEAVSGSDEALHPNMSFYLQDDKDALVLYTSGTTGYPKGVLSTHEGIAAQAEALVEAWKITKDDHLLHVLPLHHCHGIINGTIAPLFAGARISYLFPFEAGKVWEALSRPFQDGGKEETVEEKEKREKDKFTLFMAVPTIYTRLISHFRALPGQKKALATKAASSLRLAISGSAALPSPVKHAWSALSNGESLLERYGMTEMGMALSQDLDPSKRKENSVGKALPGYEVRLGSLSDKNTPIPFPTPSPSPLDPSLPSHSHTPEGEIQVRGKGVFKSYFHRAEEVTKNEFTDDGWFCTGDVAVRDLDGDYFILGRRSVDIIKTGGEKVSALEVEREILSLGHFVKEVAVLGIPDSNPELITTTDADAITSSASASSSEGWGELVTALLVLEPGTLSEIEKFNGGRERDEKALSWLREKLKERGIAKWKIPRVVRVVEEGLPRNQMGKVNKKGLRGVFFPEGEGEEGKRGE